MGRIQRHSAGPLSLRYGIAIAAMALATALRFLLNPLLETFLPYMTYFVAVLLTAWYAGSGPAMLAAALGLIAAEYLLAPAVPLRVQLIGSALFLAAAFAGSRLIAALQAARRRAEKSASETRAATEQLEKILESMSDAFVLLDWDWRCSFLNRRAAEVCRAPREQLLGKNLWEEFPEAVAGKFYSELHRAAAERAPVHFEEHYPPSDAWIEVDAYPAKQGLSVFGRDITLRKKIEQERAQILTREHAARREAERANRVKDEFLATLSHELRTPATAILGWAGMLRSGKLNDSTREQALEIIERNARAEAQLIDEILDISRIIRGKLQLDVRSVELPDVLEAAVDAIRPTAEAKGIRLEIAVDASPGPVLGDPERLEQVLWNLLANGVKFTPSGGRVQIALQRINSHVEITVSDTGEGISAEFLPHLFERFRQADSSTARPHPGLGLGLAIVRHLVELHGGTVRAESPGAGQGSVFTVRLPLPPTGLPKTPPHAQPPAPLVRLDGLFVLLVDDEPDARLLVSAVLSQHGAQVTAVGSTAEALEALESVQPAVLVSDIGMSGEDGYDLIRQVRVREAARGVEAMPAIAVTAYARAQDRLRALESGYQVHLAKPIDPAQLLLAVARSVGRVAPLREAIEKKKL